MNRWTTLLTVPCLFAALSLAGVASAQDHPKAGPADDTKQPAGPMDGQNGPPRDGDHGPGGPDGDRGPGGPGGDQGGQRPPRPDQQNGPGGGQPGARGPGGQGAPAAAGTNDVVRYQGYLNMVSQYSKLASDPESAGVAAVVSASDVLRRTGPQSAIDYFNKVLPEVKIEAVRRAIRLQLVDLYKAVKDDGKALEQLQTLITADAAGSDSAGMPAPKK